MGYVFDFHDARAWTRLTEGAHNRDALADQRRLMLEMLQPARGESVLGIGCGTGSSLLPFVGRGVEVTGIDPSPFMLDIARENLGNRAGLQRGFAEDLPYEDNSFHYACLVASLEFVEDPHAALKEACRVTRNRLFIGAFNRYAVKGLERRLRGIFSRTIYNKARFFSIWELKRHIRRIMGNVPIRWQCVGTLPNESGRVCRFIKNAGLDRRFPFGTMFAMVVVLEPRFRTRPLQLRYGGGKRTTGAVAG